MKRWMNEALEPSMCTRLDIAAMYPHSEQFLEYEANAHRTWTAYKHLSEEPTNWEYPCQHTGSP